MKDLLKTLLLYLLLIISMYMFSYLLDFLPNKKEDELLRYINNISQRVENIDNKLNSLLNE